MPSLKSLSSMNSSCSDTFTSLMEVNILDTGGGMLLWLLVEKEEFGLLDPVRIGGVGLSKSISVSSASREKVSSSLSNSLPILSQEEELEGL